MNQPKPLPPNLRKIWRWFWDLNEGRSYHNDLIPDQTDRGEFCWRSRQRVDRFSHSDIRAWTILNDITLEPWEMAALSMLDEVYIAAFNSADTPKHMTVSSHKLTPQLFDALFRDK